MTQNSKYTEEPVVLEYDFHIFTVIALSLHGFIIN